MMRLVVAAAASVGLILFLTFIVARLIRSRSRGLSVRMQVFLALAVIVGAFAVGLGLLVIDRVDARAERLALEAATDESHAVAALIQSEIDRSHQPLSALATQLDRWEAGPEPSEFDTMGLELLGREERLLFPQGRESRAQEDGAVFVDTPIRVDGKVTGIVRVVKPTIVIEAMLADFAPTVLVISLLLGAVAALAAAMIGKTIAAPIEGLSTFSEKVAAGQPTELPAHVSGREVARLVSSIDAMRRQLEGRPFVETFAADLSHELKNPVAAIRASAEVLEDGALEEPAQAKRFVARIAEAAQRIERLLDELLSLAKVETRGAEEMEPVRLDRLTEELRTNCSAPERVELSQKGNLVVRGDRLWLGRAISNLIDNALVHSSAETKVRLELRREQEFVELLVQSQGSVPRHVRSDLFRRFITTRGDRGGTGLGLSIVRAVAEAHSGSVELRDLGPPRVVFALRLPAARS